MARLIGLLKIVKFFRECKSQRQDFRRWEDRRTCVRRLAERSPKGWHKKTQAVAIAWVFLL